MCFLLRRKSEGEAGDLIQAVAWPGPFNFATTEEEKKIYQSFPFDKDGLSEAVAWLNRCYREKFE